jgi:hypothetical protein
MAEAPWLMQQVMVVAVVTVVEVLDMDLAVTHLQAAAADAATIVAMAAVVALDAEVITTSMKNALCVRYVRRKVTRLTATDKGSMKIMFQKKELLQLLHAQ